MLVLKRTYISSEQPEVMEGLWLKPVSGGFAAYKIENGNAEPMKLVDDNNTQKPDDDTPINVKNKADKVSSATNNNFAALNSNGNLKDSGKSASDFEPAGAVAAAVIGLAGGIIYKAVINEDADLPTNLTASDNGFQYVVGTAGTYQTEELAVGDYLLWNGTTSEWNIVKAVSGNVQAND